MRRPTALSPRKKPVQRRAHETTDAILEAAAHILIKDGFEAATTNRIAERAGVSIGSLYQYFPGKDAILVALAERHFARMGVLLDEMAAKAATLEPEEAARVYVRAKFAAHRLDRKLHAVLFEHMPRLRGLHMWAERTAQIVHGYYERHRTKLQPRDLDLASFVTTHAVEAVAEAAALLRPRLLEDDAFVEEVADLIVRYILAPKSKARRRRS